MDKAKVISQTVQFVKKQLTDAEGGHDWFHIERVWKTAKTIARKESANMFIVELGALLHDIADSKFHDGDESIGPKLARSFLENNGVYDDIIVHIEHIIKNISFKGGNFDQEFSSIELDVIQDADRLDAIGAIGIARCFNYGGYKNRTLYDPNIKPVLDMTKDVYKKAASPTINHFYEKLLLLKDRMNTETGRQMAKKRHNFMESYLEEFYAEWNGER